MTASSKSTVYFFFEKPVNLRERTRLKAFIALLFRKEKMKLEGLNFIFCSDKRLLEINRKFLQHNYYTDIITFELSGPGNPVQGEIYISLDRVRENAGIAKESLHRELHRVIFHGVLHLCGYKDKSKKEKEEMRAKENQALSAYFG